jgi:hypothetical protein
MNVADTLRCCRIKPESKFVTREKANQFAISENASGKWSKNIEIGKFHKPSSYRTFAEIINVKCGGLKICQVI